VKTLRGGRVVEERCAEAVRGDWRWLGVSDRSRTTTIRFVGATTGALIVSISRHRRPQYFSVLCNLTRPSCPIANLPLSAPSDRKKHATRETPVQTVRSPKHLTTSAVCTGGAVSITDRLSCMLSRHVRCFRTGVDDVIMWRRVRIN